MTGERVASSSTVEVTEVRFPTASKQRSSALPGTRDPAELTLVEDGEVAEDDRRRQGDGGLS